VAQRRLHQVILDSPADGPLRAAAAAKLTPDVDAVPRGPPVSVKPVETSSATRTPYRRGSRPATGRCTAPDAAPYSSPSAPSALLPAAVWDCRSSPSHCRKEDHNAAVPFARALEHRAHLTHDLVHAGVIPAYSARLPSASLVGRDPTLGNLKRRVPGARERYRKYGVPRCASMN
jgi:hypothetical protein